jgi:hypothetical protein
MFQAGKELPEICGTGDVFTILMECRRYAIRNQNGELSADYSERG